MVYDNYIDLFDLIQASVKVYFDSVLLSSWGHILVMHCVEYKLYNVQVK